LDDLDYAVNIPEIKETFIPYYPWYPIPDPEPWYTKPQVTWKISNTY
jgi:hypothetical protein